MRDEMKFVLNVWRLVLNVLLEKAQKCSEMIPGRRKTELIKRWNAFANTGMGSNRPWKEIGLFLNYPWINFG